MLVMPISAPTGLPKTSKNVRKSPQATCLLRHCSQAGVQDGFFHPLTSTGTCGYTLAARLVHKLVFSMPPGTAPDCVLRATRAFCREEFALKHRYAMALHADEPHPHVHVLVKAMSESGQRLDIRKSTLRAWRESFAEKPRELGVPAHASSRHVRGVSAPRLADGRYRSLQRGASTVVQGIPGEPNPAAALDRRERSHRLVD